MKLQLIIDNDTIKMLILNHLQAKLGDSANLTINDIKIKVKSKQNYREHEWENGELQVTYEGNI